MDVGGEIYAPQNLCSVSVAKEYVLAQWPSFAAIERDPSVHFDSSRVLQKGVSESPSPQSSPRKAGARRIRIRF